MYKIDILSVKNGEVFSETLLNFSEKYQIKKEKTKKRVSEWREKQKDKENVTGYERVSNARKVKLNKVKLSKVKESKLSEPSLHSVLKNIFEEFYNRGREENLWYYWEGKDGKSLKLLIPKLKKLCKGQEDKMPDTFRAMLEKNTDKWINERLAMTLINSKYNEIVRKIKGSTDLEIEEFERKYYEQHG